MTNEERNALLAIGHWVEFHGGDGKLSKQVKKTMKALRSSTKTPSPLKGYSS